LLFVVLVIGLFYKNKTTVVTSGAGTTYPSEAPELIKLTDTIKTENSVESGVNHHNTNPNP